MKLFTEHAEYFIAAAFAAGILIIISDDLKLAFKRIMLSHELEKGRKKDLSDDPLTLHLETIFKLIPGMADMNPKIFVVFSGYVAAFVLYESLKSMSIIYAFMFSMVSALMPYVLLRIRCEVIRSRVSGEGVKMISILLSAYRINGGNISEALEFTAGQRDEIPQTAPLISRMIMKLRESEGNDMIAAATDGFAKTVGSNWAGLLASNIKIAFTEGAGISLALEEIHTQLREAEIVMEERSRMNSESVRMTVFMIPLTFLITVYMSVKQMGIPLRELIRNQFSDQVASSLFMLMIMLFVFNLAACELMKNRKLDI